MTDLRFTGVYSPPPGGAVPLRFGAGGDEFVATPTLGTALRGIARAAWRIAVQGSAGRQALTWRTAAAAGRHTAAPWAPARAGMGGRSILPWRAAAASGRRAQVSAQQAAATGTLLQLTAEQGLPVGTLLHLTAAQGWLAAGHSRMPWQDAHTVRRLVQIGSGVPAVPVWVPVGAGGGVALAAAGRSLMPWAAGLPLYSEGGPFTRWESPVPPGPAPCYAPAAALRFDAPLSGLAHLLFACRHALALVRVPIREVYMIVNTVTLSRLSDGVEIPALGMSLTLDVDSWAWGFSATLPGDALSLVEPPAPGEPCLLQAMVNGTPVRVAVESVSRERTFGRSGVRISGRGISAALADPYQPTTIFSAASTLTSQQLLDQALPVGWDAEWGLTAWSVPGGVWSHQGTPITAALAIAAAGGGYVQPHDTLQRLRVLPLYPTAPWDWHAATPDLELPSAVVQREAIEWVERPRYNRVYVSGVSAGVLARVTRSGTAGDLVAPMVTDALTTQVDAGRQRGLAILANTGRQAFVTLRLPVLPETGLIRPGKLIRYTDGASAVTGLSRGLSVDKDGAALWQSVRIETHVE